MDALVASRVIPPSDAFAPRAAPVKLQDSETEQTVSKVDETAAVALNERNKHEEVEVEADPPPAKEEEPPPQVQQYEEFDRGYVGEGKEVAYEVRRKITNEVVLRIPFNLSTEEQIYVQQQQKAAAAQRDNQNADHQDIVA